MTTRRRWTLAAGILIVAFFAFRNLSWNHWRPFIAWTTERVACSTFVKYERKVQNIDVELTCGELAAITDLGAFCQPIIDQRIIDDPGLVTELPTREVQSLCPSGAGG